MTYVVRPISDRTAFTGEQSGYPFSALWSATERLLLDEVAKLKGERLVVEVDVREQDIRVDGRLRANAVAATSAARVAFESEHGPLTYGTDRYAHWQQNVRAIALGLEALRKVDRYGITRRGEQYAGFKAIGGGSATPMPAAPTMGRDEALRVIADFDPGEWTDDLVRRHRRARAAVHPDRHGGDQSRWDLVETASRVLGLAR